MKSRTATFIAGGLAAVAVIATVAAFATQQASPAQDFGLEPGLAAGPDTIPPVSAPFTAGPVPIQSTDPSSLAAQVQVSPDRITIPAIGVDMPVVSKGLAPDGSMALPDEAATAAWYRHGATPGEQGRAALIAAHVSSVVDGVGPFSLLPNVLSGDTVSVTLSDGTQVPYTVVRKETLSKTVIDYEAITLESPGMLILVTCGGEWDPQNRTHEDNVLVWAVSAAVP